MKDESTGDEAPEADHAEIARRKLLRSFLTMAARFHQQIRSQLGQDLFALLANNLRLGVYLDIGAAHPLHISNTKLLEDNGWQGLLVEPNSAFGDLIREQRSGHLVAKAVVPDPQATVAFQLVPDDPEFSRVETVTAVDVHDERGRRANTVSQEVEAVAIGDLCDEALERFGSVDFVSIDIEGLEYDVLARFPFERCRPRAFCVEHNNSPNRDPIRELMSRWGYLLVCSEISSWDDWFISEDAAAGFEEGQVDSLRGEAVEDPAALVNLMAIANQAAVQEQYEDAAALCEKKLASAPTDLPAHVLHARLALESGDPLEARRRLEISIEHARQQQNFDFLRRRIEPLAARIDGEIAGGLERQPMVAATDLEAAPPATLQEWRRALARPHDFEANKLYVQTLVHERRALRPKASLPRADDFEGRIALARRGAHALNRTGARADAGRCVGSAAAAAQIMFNGVKVPIDGYYGAWMTKLIEVSGGHHEPQEEAAFEWLLTHIPNSATMVELGAYWSFYSAWFLSRRTEAATAVAVEPDPANLLVGLETARLNGVRVHPQLGRIGNFGDATDGDRPPSPEFDLEEAIRRARNRTIDLLHADIQGEETALVETLRGSAENVLNLVISTHGHQRHYDVVEALSECGYYILCDVEPSESYSYDGLVVARHRGAPPLPYFDVPRHSDEPAEAEPVRYLLPRNNTIILDNTVRPDGVVKTEIYNALEAAGFDVCVLGEKLRGNWYIQYAPNPAGFELALEDVHTRSHDGINLWSVCQGNIGYEMPGLDPAILSGAELEAVGRLFARAINFIEFFRRIIDRHRPRMIVVWGGMFIEPTIMRILGERHGIPVRAIEFSFDAQRIWFDDVGRIGNDNGYPEFWREFETTPFAASEKAWVERWIEGNYSGKALNQPKLPLSERAQAFLDRQSQPPVLLIGQCTIDTVISYDSIHFPHAPDAYARVIEHFAASGGPLIVKSHPGDRQEYKEILRGMCERHPNVLYVGLDTDENVYRLMDVCRAGITINSQAGLEMLAKGKRVLCLGRAFYSKPDFAAALEGPEQLKAAIDSLAASPALSAEEHLRVKHYLFGLLRHFLVDTSRGLDGTRAQIASKLPVALTPLSNKEIFVTNHGPRRRDEIRAVFLHASPSWGGSGFYMQDLALAMQRQGHKVLVLAEGTCVPTDEGVVWHTLTFAGQMLSPEIRDLVAAFDPNLIFEAGVRSKPMRAALELAVAHQAALIVHGEDDEFIPFKKHYPINDEEILNCLDSEVVDEAQLAGFLSRIDLEHTAKVFSDPYHDRWVEPILRAILYHKADGLTAIWHPMKDRLAARFGKEPELLPPIVDLSKFEPPRLSEAQVRQLRKDLGAEDRLIFFVNGTIYSYSDEFHLFVDALERLQARSGIPVTLLACGNAEMRGERTISYRSLGRPSDERYWSLIAASDVICAPGIPDTFNTFRLSSRLVKGMMAAKPIFTFKTGFAESLEDGVDGFFTYTDEVEEWCAVLEQTLDPEARARAGRRGHELVRQWFDSGAVAQRLARSWQNILEARTKDRPLHAGVVAPADILSTLSRIYDRNLTMQERSRLGLQLHRRLVSVAKAGPAATVGYGFSLDPDLARHGVHFFTAVAPVTGLSVTPHRSSPTIRLTLDLKKDATLASSLRIFDEDGEKALRIEETAGLFVIEFDAARSDFVIAQPTLLDRKTHIYWNLVGVEVAGAESRALASSSARAAGGSAELYKAALRCLSACRRANSSLKKKRVAEAYATARSATSLLPTSRVATRLLERAEQQYGEKLQIDAQRALKARRPGAAIKAARKLLDLRPDASVAHLVLAEAAYAQGKRSKALRHLQAAQDAVDDPNIIRRLKEMRRPQLINKILRPAPYLGPELPTRSSSAR